MRLILLLLIALQISCSAFAAESITLIKNGKSSAAIYVAPEIMETRTLKADASAEERAHEPLRVRVRESVKDLALTLNRIAGAEVPIHTRLPNPGERTIPILIGGYADKTFGPFAMKSEFKQGYRLVVSKKAVGIQGETFEGVSYAVYEILDRLGCRWIMPGELGEVIPSLQKVELPLMDLKTSAATGSRGVWYADDAFRYRNRMGGFKFTAGHALEGYITKEQLEAHPDWNSESAGKRALHRCDVGYRLCWANPEVSAAVADSAIARLDKNYAPCISISPGDGINFCECAECKALDTGDWDPSMACTSITDRYVNFANRIAERVAKKYPEVKLGFLAYVQFTRPPLREKLHPSLIPQLAPITYCRAHTLDDPACPSRQQLKPILDGWGKVSKNIAMYEYYFHLAEVAAPFPAIRRNLVELPIQYANHVTMWTPESMPNFESFTPGLYLGIRMSWYPMSNPQDTLNEFYTGFYGAASNQMKDYWQYIDDCWTTVAEHAGCGFGYTRRFTPDRMTEARRLMNAALSACKTAMEYRRARLADDSLRQFELFMKLRWDLFAGRFTRLESDAAIWTGTHQSLAEHYKENYTFTRTGWAADTVAVRYFNIFYGLTYTDASRISRDFKLLTPAVNTWNYEVDRKKEGEAAGWHQPEFDDAKWKKTDVSVDTWATLELMDYYGPVWYRTKLKAPVVAEGKKVYLWVSATDGACKVFVNGKHVPYTNSKGESVPEADGYCAPFSFEITGLLTPTAENQITIVGTRNFLNELGTGGLLGPVILYAEK
ncbi:MAG: DUF4838 domain-containing protein [Planctomycetota bacterium]|nr:DUF4838 domain-containing protein [Planctomycetota bacterium]